MRWCLLLLACEAAPPMLPPASTAWQPFPVEKMRYQPVFDAVDGDRLRQHLTATQGERFSAAGKARFRDYFRGFLQPLGYAVEEQAFTLTRPAADETEGHNLEAVLPGESADSIVLLAHYDSIGPTGQETRNPAVDDNMSGMAILLEAARVLRPLALHYTVRFVAVDQEELTAPVFEGTQQYVQRLRGLRVVAAVDHEQTGWREGDASFDISNCLYGAGLPDPAGLANALADTARAFSPLSPQWVCLAGGSDDAATAAAQISSIMFTEHDARMNDHFDDSGGDTLDRVDVDYLFQIAQIAVTFDAELAALDGGSFRTSW